MKLEFYPEEWERIINHCDFTDEEINIIRLLRKGWFAIDIGEELHISKRTVERRKRKITQKITHYILQEG